MDGIPVKISERYKPPKKINLPMSVQNRLNAEIKFDEYDFTLEKTVVEQVAQLKELRRRKREERLRKLEEQNQTVPDPDQLETETSRLSISASPLSHQHQQQNCILMPVPISTSGSSDEESSKAGDSGSGGTRKNDGRPQSRGTVVGSINISDFESDTSSPFDNMELKTINDLEELAHVLASESQPKDKGSYPNGLLTSTPTAAVWSNADDNGAGGYYHHMGTNSGASNANWFMATSATGSGGIMPVVQQAYVLQHQLQVQPHRHQVSPQVEAVTDPAPPVPVPSSSPCSSSGGGPSDESSSSASSAGILHALQSTLDERRAAVAAQSFRQTVTTNNASPRWQRDRDKDKDGDDNWSSAAAATLSALSPQAQLLATSVAEMGFPLARTARATHLFGNNQAKVIEFLLQVQKLEEAGGGSRKCDDRAEKALLANGYDFDSSLAYLQSLRQLVNEFGFPEDKVIDALAKFNNDRDRAVDYLIS